MRMYIAKYLEKARWHAQDTHVYHSIGRGQSIVGLDFRSEICSCPQVRTVDEVTSISIKPAIKELSFYELSNSKTMSAWSQRSALRRPPSQLGFSLPLLDERRNSDTYLVFSQYAFTWMH